MNDATRSVGRYQIVRQVGRGGMAVVYLAHQTDLDREVALKELGQFYAGDPALAARFVQESRMVGSFNHPNIVTVYDYFEHDGVPFIAMEYLERGSLRPFVGHTTPAQTVGVLEGALAGLAQAERRDIVHRDIKPENLMVTADGEVKIADFGIAKALSDAAGRQHLTATGTTIGTPAYMAPEQASATGLGPWTDLYSLGIVAYEMTAGRVPFHDSDTPVAVLLRHVNEEIPPVRSVDPTVDKRLSDWIDRMLIKDPERRTRSAREAWYQLEEIAVAMLGPLWRREARLLGEGAGGAAPLTPAPFSPVPTAAEPAEDAGYATFGAPAVTQPPTSVPPAAAAPAVPTSARTKPAEPVGAQPAPPEPVAPVQVSGYQTVAGAGPEPRAEPEPEPGPALEPPPPPPPPPGVPVATESMPEPALEATTAPRAVAPDETFQFPSQRGPSRAGGRRTALIAVGVVVVAAGAGIAVLLGRGGSSGAHHTTGAPPAAVPAATPEPAGFVPGVFSGAVAFGGQPWAVRNGDSLVDLASPAQAIPIGQGARAVASGAGALWVVRDLSATSSELDRVVPGSTPAIQKRIPIAGRVNGIRPVIAGGAAWQLLATGGLLRISLTSGAAVTVKGTPRSMGSLEAAGGSVWATDGTGEVARIPATAARPTATLIPLPGAGWIAPAGNAVYIADSTGVSKLTATGGPVPVVGITTRPDRLAVVGGDLWMSFYPAGGAAQLRALELDDGHRSGAAVSFTPATGQSPSRLQAIGGAFWISVEGASSGGTAAANGIQPFSIRG